MCLNLSTMKDNNKKWTVHHSSLEVLTFYQLSQPSKNEFYNVHLFCTLTWLTQSHVI